MKEELMTGIMKVYKIKIKYAHNSTLLHNQLTFETRANQAL